MRKVLIFTGIVVLIVVILIAGIALRPVSAPADITPTTFENCAVLSLDNIELNPQQAAVQAAVQNQLNQISPPIALPLNDTGLKVTPAVSKCVPLQDSEK